MSRFGKQEERPFTTRDALAFKKRFDAEVERLVKSGYSIFHDRSIRLGGKPMEASWEQKEYLKWLNRTLDDDFPA